MKLSTRVRVNPDPVNVNPNPVNLNPDPVNVSPDPVNLNPDPVNLNPDPVNLNPDPKLLNFHHSGAAIFSIGHNKTMTFRFFFLDQLNNFRLIFYHHIKIRLELKCTFFVKKNLFCI